MMLRLVITTTAVCLLLTSGCVCGDQTNNEVDEKLILPDHQLEIVNGTDADEGEFPFAVSEGVAGGEGVEVMGCVCCRCR